MKATDCFAFDIHCPPSSLGHVSHCLPWWILFFFFFLPLIPTLFPLAPIKGFDATPLQDLPARLRLNSTLTWPWLTRTLQLTFSKWCSLLSCWGCWFSGEDRRNEKREGGWRWALWPSFCPCVLCPCERCAGPVLKNLKNEALMLINIRKKIPEGASNWALISIVIWKVVDTLDEFQRGCYSLQNLSSF